MTEPVHVVGASGRSGLALCRSLVADGIPLVAVVRNRGQVLPTLAAPFAGKAKRHGGHPHQQPEPVHES